MDEIGQAVSIARPGMHGYVALFKTPTEFELKAILAWLGHIADDAGEISGCAKFWTRPLEEPSTASVGEAFVPEPRMFAAHVHQEAGVVKARGTVLATVDGGMVHVIQVFGAK